MYCSLGFIVSGNNNVGEAEEAPGIVTSTALAKDPYLPDKIVVLLKAGLGVNNQQQVSNCKIMITLSRLRNILSKTIIKIPSPP